MGTFVVGALFFGLLLAFLLEKGVRGEGFFRLVYIFPLAVSFIAARRLALAHEPGSRRPRQRAQRRVRQARHRLSANDWYLGENWGWPPSPCPRSGRSPATSWPFTLRASAAFPRSCARQRGWTAPRNGAYRHVVFPHLRPVTLTALIILGHISIKVFDLIVAIGGKQLITQTPAVYMWILIYDAFDYAEGAAIATLLLIGISILVIPYLIYSVRTEQRA